ncbi:TIGR00725 family protein [Streptosporangium sp. NPDC051022]|uniref:TIGR00725 family protein n=1 Tax=Streptosporangium sp. NPDC051022 TaxID=3155752 RepID=UPI00341E9187
MTIQVSVCGPRDCTGEDEANAREVGRLLAERGAVVICGGYTGVMAAVAAGARSAGGTVVGILSLPDRQGANPDLSIVIPTGVGEARNGIIVNSGDAVIVVGGSWGTLSELALAMRRGRTPVVQLGGWRLLDQDGRPLPGIRHAASPAQALDLTGLWPDTPAFGPGPGEADGG